jgi:hypothetical protein
VLGRWALAAVPVLLWVWCWATPAFAQSARLVLRWKDVPDARGYELQIARDAAFVEVVLQTRVPLAAYRWDVLPQATHWWRVRSFDAEGRPSEWSQPRTVALESTVPVPRLPADDAQVACGQPVEVAFEPSPLVREFLVELSQSKDFAPARQLSSKSAASPLGVLGAGVWYWRAKAVDVRGRTGEASGVRRFTVRPAATKPRPVADVVLGVPSVSLSWAEVACASSWLVEASNETREKVSLPSPTTSLAFKPNAAGEYRWRVAAVDERGVPGEWSPEATFRVRLATPVPRGESSTPLKLDLAWQPTVGASQYRVEVATERDFKQLLASGQVTGSAFRATDVPPGPVYWRVFARDDGGHSSAASEPRAVDVVAPDPLDAIVWTRPEGDVVVSAGAEVPIDWRPVDKAIFYELEVDGVIRPVPAPPKTVSDLAAGAHQVRLRARGNASRSSAWTAPKEIFVGTPAVESAEVSLSGDQVRVVLRDGKRRPVVDVVPRFTVARGAIDAPTGNQGAFVARWRAPADGEDVLRIEERAFRVEVELERPLPVAWSVGLRLGGLFNFSSVSSPTAGAGLTWLLPVFSRRLGLEARVGLYAASRAVDLGPDRVAASAWVVPFSALLGWHQPVGGFVVSAGVGPAFQVVALEVAGLTETRVVGDLELAVRLARALGPGRVEVELSGLFGSVDGQLARLRAGGLGLKLGYAFDLGAR